MGVVGLERRHQRAAGPRELAPAGGLPAFEDAVQQAADKPVTAPDTVEHGDLARLDDLPLPAGAEDCAPAVAVGVHHLAQGVGEDAHAGKLPARGPDHTLESLDLPRQVAPAGRRPLDAETELEVLLVADEDVRRRRDLGEGAPQLRLAPLPEGGAVVQVEADAAPGRLGPARELQTALARLGRQGGEEPREMHDLHALRHEDAVEVEIGRRDRAAHLARAVVLHARAARAESAVGQVELVAVAPGRSLVELLALDAHVARGQVLADHPRDGAPLDEGRQHLDGQTQVRGHARHVRFRAGHLQAEGLAAVERLPVERRQPHTHARRHQQGRPGILSQGQIHVAPSFTWSNERISCTPGPVSSNLPGAGAAGAARLTRASGSVIMTGT